MREPKRLVEGGDDGLDIELLRFARAEEPSAAKAAKLIGALGLGLAGQSALGTGLCAAEGAKGVVGAATSSATKGATAIASLSSSAKPMVLSVGLTLGKWAAVGALCGTTATAAVQWSAAPVQKEVPASQASSVRSAPGAVKRPVAASSALPAVTVELPPLLVEPAASPIVLPPRPAPLPDGSYAPRLSGARPPALARPSAPVWDTLPDPPAPLVSPPPTPALSPSPLMQQIQAVDLARERLAAHDAPAAIALLQQYQAAYQGGAFAPEAKYLLIKALLEAGKREEAVTLAREGLETGALGVYARQVLAALPEAGLDAP